MSYLIILLFHNRTASGRRKLKVAIIDSHSDCPPGSIATPSCFLLRSFYCRIGRDARVHLSSGTWRDRAIPGVAAFS